MQSKLNQAVAAHKGFVTGNKVFREGGKAVEEIGRIP
jgi:hypothetical protein